MNIETVEIDSLQPARWATSHLLRPDERSLIQSMTDWGWIQPLVVRAEDRTIIDGNLRWVIAKDTKGIQTRFGTQVPVVWVSCDEVDAMMMHIRLNRSKGMSVAKKTSNLLKTIRASRKYDDAALKSLLVMTREEFEILADGSYVKQKSLKEHTYSRGWIPVEAPKPGSAIAGEMRFERPANKDN
jgi:ParB-like chromosome segregation protein Spo0J